jgi:putative flippase GtrA
MVTGFVALLLVLALGFYVHRDPRFPGSLAGSVLGIAAAALMLIPLAYLVVKRLSFLKKYVTRAVSMRSLLAIHIYAGVLGPILGVLHSGHKFDSPLGISLTAMTIVVTLSGFVGRYLMSTIATDMRQQQQLLAGLRVAYDRVAAELTQDAGQATALRPFAGFFRRLTASFFVGQGGAAAQPLPAAARALRLSESMADLEYAVKTHEVFRQAFGRWLACHIIITLILYMLLALHIWSAWYFGIRWLI